MVYLVHALYLADVHVSFLHQDATEGRVLRRTNKKTETKKIVTCFAFFKSKNLTELKLALAVIASAEFSFTDSFKIGIVFFFTPNVYIIYDT